MFIKNSMSGVSDEIQRLFEGGDESNAVNEHLGKHGAKYVVIGIALIIGAIVMLLLLYLVFRAFSCPSDEASEFSGGSGRHIHNKIDPGRMISLETQNALDAPYGSADLLNPQCVRKEMKDYRNMHIDNFEPNEFMGFTGRPTDGRGPVDCSIHTNQTGETRSSRSVKSAVYNEGKYPNQAPLAVSMNLLNSN